LENRDAKDVINTYRLENAEGVMRKACLVLLFTVFIASAFLCSAQSNGVPAGILGRVLYLKNGTKTGTAFLIDYKGKEYLLTARHMIEGLTTDNAKLQGYRSADWREITADIILPENKNVDIAVLDIHHEASKGWSPDLSGESPTIGGQVYFIGYPDGLHSLYSNGEYLPLVKAGVLSGLDNADPDEVVYYIDGFNNPGFSGGPVVFLDNAKHEWHFFAVVIGYRTERIKTLVRGKEVGLCAGIWKSGQLAGV
jgi:S1-C subfamily serine protease